jgi:broad specificity phosphatase PhoE
MMSWPSLLVAIRHAESEGNICEVDERAQKAIPNYRFALTPRGEAQAKLTGDYIRRTYGEFDAYYTSYYERAKQTFREMYPGVSVIEDARLAEGQRGIWHTMTIEQITDRFPEEENRKKKEDLYHYRPLGGENWPDIELRIYSFLDMLRRDFRNKRVLIVAHGQWLILLQKVIERKSIEETLTQFHKGCCGNASVMVYACKYRAGKNQLVLQQFDYLPWQGKL